mgnify:CR=1 FL=1
MLFTLVLILTLTTENTEAQSCGQNTQSKTLARQIISHPKQNRKTLICSTLLSKIAHLKAKELASSFTQTNMTANEFVVKQGYRFPNYYPLHGNQVEAVAKGSEPFAYLLQSDKHRNHVLGLGDFFSLQTEIGVGLFEDEDPATPDQWVVLIAQPWQAPKIKFKPVPLLPPNKKDVCSGNWKKSADRSLKTKCKKLDEEAYQK